MALIVLGKKLSEDPYSEEDLRLLETLASQAAVVIDHTHTYEEVRKEFESNQKKLYETEKQLEHSQRLASLGTLAAGIAHEIRNPLAYNLKLFCFYSIKVLKFVVKRYLWII